MPIRVATWNVNSVRQRIDLLLSWLKECQPDIVCLQEIKCVDEAFPRLEIEALGYNVVTHGQKTFNGVALLSKLRFDETKSGLSGDDEDAHARFVEGVVTLKQGVVRVACLYLPNGNPANTDKYPYKLKWMSRLLEYSKERLKTEEPLILAGDFNVIPAARDVYNPAAWTIKEGAMVGKTSSGQSQAFTKTDYSNFRLIVWSRMVNGMLWMMSGSRSARSSMSSPPSALASSRGRPVVRSSTTAA